jgi:signal transduction histidine kinase
MFFYQLCRIRARRLQLTNYLCRVNAVNHLITMTGGQWDVTVPLTKRFRLNFWCGAGQTEGRPSSPSGLARQTEGNCVTRAAQPSAQSVRFDDRVSTLLKWSQSSAQPARAAALRNLLDLLLQNQSVTHGYARAWVFAALSHLRTDVDDGFIVQCAAKLARLRPAPIDLASWFLGDAPRVRHAALLALNLRPEGWFSILPQLSRDERQLVHSRSDIDQESRAILSALGLPRLLLAGPQTTAAMPDVAAPLPATDSAQPEPILLPQSEPELVPLFVADPPQPLPPQPLQAKTSFDPAPSHADVPAGDLATTPEFQASQAQVRDLLRRIADFQSRRNGREVPKVAPVEDAFEPLEPLAPLPAEPEPTLVLEQPLPPLPPLPPISPEPSPPLAATDPVRDPLADIITAAADILWETDRYGIFTTVLATGSEQEFVASWRQRALLAVLGQPSPPEALERALRRRVPFRDVLVQVGRGPDSANWCLSGVPVFEARSGVFQGYRGIVRPPMALEMPVMAGARAPVPAPAEALTSLAHEIRTPLNAIMGFAQMIEASARGPVPEVYKDQASAILAQSQQVLRAIDDVTDAGRLDRGSYPLDAGHFQVDGLVAAVIADEQAAARMRGVTLLGRLGAGLPPVWGDRDAAGKALARLVVAAVSAAHSGETIIVSARAAQADHICLSVTRPRRLRQVDDAQLFGASANTDAIPVGIGFALRLSGQLAGALGGRVDAAETSLDLFLPCLPPSDSAFATRLPSA